MAEQYLSMSANAIAKIVGTVGSPLIVIAELIKNGLEYLVCSYIYTAESLMLPEQTKEEPTSEQHSL